MDPVLAAVLSIASAVVASLSTVVRHLYKRVEACEAREAKCNESLATMRAERVSLYALVEQMRWSGSISLEAVIVVNMTTGTVVEWNPGATMLTHYTEREMLGKDFKRIMPPRYHQRHDDAIAAARRGAELPMRGPILGHVLTEDGVEVPVSITLSGWRTGQATFVAATMRRRVEAADAKGADN